MKVKLLNGTPHPEEEVVRAARNDYRAEGVIDYSIEELVEAIKVSDKHHDDRVAMRNGLDRSSYTLTEAKKRTLLDHLMESGHWGPFEHPAATIAIEGVTRVVTHQIVRHRHFTYDQQSLRYVKLDGIDTDDRDDLARQFRFPDVSDGEIVDRHGVHEIDADYVDKDFKEAYSSAAHYYQSLLDRDVPQEIARMVLPIGTKTNIVMSGNARAWMHILKVRTKADVQSETRECANAIFDELKTWMPYSFEKYESMLPMKLGP